MRGDIRNLRVERIVKEAIDEACRALDIQPDDTARDSKAWAAVRQLFADLLLEAYRRNHNGEP